MTKRGVSRRRFLGTAAGAVAFPYIVPSSVFGAGAPSGKITMGCIGVGSQGSGNMNGFLNKGDARVLAVCDVDKGHRDGAKKRVDDKYGNSDCAAYHDFRELIARDDIDALSLALPDHWHSIPVIMAARAGKDMYGEKPLARTIAEGKRMVEAVHRYDRIWQTGSWQRSQGNFHHACELV
ncbi:MAG: Gfo/Idh/MocA family oxidoreductase, partial [Planctomycetes bacterium]|nr:Gfo/Idh/MocA family oxidoreductase [Planctomycetota bacterium]